VLAAFVIIIIFFAMECKLYFKLNTRHGRVLASIAVMLKTMIFVVIGIIQSKNYLDKKTIFSLYLWISAFCGYELLILNTRLIFAFFFSAFAYHFIDYLTDY
jgi:hypothetical protein